MINNSVNLSVRNNQQKSAYSPPEVGITKLDNEISLALESLPPSGDGENVVMNAERISESPFRSMQT